jgi:hypothetical protein
MKRPQQTTIDDLTTVGHELAEEHLGLAVGSALNLRVPSPRTVTRSITNGRVGFDEEYDW